MEIKEVKTEKSKVLIHCKGYGDKYDGDHTKMKTFNCALSVTDVAIPCNIWMKDLVCRAKV